LTLKVRKSSLILLLLTLYGVNYFVFERLLFFNELLSLIGFVYFIKYSFRGNYKFYYPQNLIYRCILLLIILFGLYALISIYLKTNWYYYFRNTSMIYSIFGFFIGYNLYLEQYAFFNRIKGAIYGYALLAFLISPALGISNLIDRNAYSFWFAFLQKNWKPLSLLLFILINILYFLSYTSLTVMIILISVLGIVVFIRSYTGFKVLIVTAIITFCILFAQAIPYLKLYKDNYSLFGDVEYVYSQHPVFRIDDNTSWRLIFWYRTLVEIFPENLIGIGIGTPILPYTQGVTTSDLIFSDEHVAHVIGTHNTFITVFMRFGILSFILLAIIYREVFREFFYYKKYYLKNKNDGGIFIGFIVLTIVGMFNLLIETPTLSILYWVSLGFLARAVYHRKIKSYEVQNL